MYTKQEIKEMNQRKNARELQQTVIEMLSDVRPRYFLSIHFPPNWKLHDVHYHTKVLNQKMKTVEKTLSGPRDWEKHLATKFIYTTEHNTTTDGVHFHLYLYDCPYDMDTLLYTLNRAGLKQDETCKLLEITDTSERCYQYGVKEFFQDVFESKPDFIGTHDTLFDKTTFGKPKVNKLERRKRIQENRQSMYTTTRAKQDSNIILVWHNY